jgi:hypothetical protein
MKNSLMDLNNHLFCQLERLSDESLIGEDLKEELNRGKVVAIVAAQIIKNAALSLNAAKATHDGIITRKLPMLGDK